MNLRSLPHLDLERLLVSESRIWYPFVWIQFPEISQSLKNTAEREREQFFLWKAVTRDGLRFQVQKVSQGSCNTQLFLGTLKK